MTQQWYDWVFYLTGFGVWSILAVIGVFVSSIVLFSLIGSALKYGSLTFAKRLPFLYGVQRLDGYSKVRKYKMINLISIGSLCLILANQKEEK
jgi:hypothetical protein